MKEIKRYLNEDYSVVEINKEERKLLKAFEEMRKVDKEASLLLIDSDTYFGYNIETGTAVVLEFRDLSCREY